MTYRNRIIQGDCLTILKELPAGLVDCVVTSPPYWGLRDYGVEGQLGLEPTIEEYISNMTEVFREVRRVLKDTGTLWLNMGDGYAGTHTTYKGKQKKWQHGDYPGRQEVGQPGHGLKPKDLIGQPWRLAFALQADGWYLRSDIIWHKPNPMPESVTDRPTKSHEYIFLLSKKANYFYDAEAIKEASIYPNDDQKSRSIKMPDGWDTDPGSHSSIHRNGRQKGQKRYPTDTIAGIREGSATYPTRNKRTVWTITTQPYPEAHFATFPEALVEPCIRAGTSERGNCAECGKPWVRVVEKGELKQQPGCEYRAKTVERDTRETKDKGWSDEKNFAPSSYYEKKTLGWKPSCSCDAEETVRPIVLDPFMGSGTVALVAKKLNRDYIGIELNPEYVEMARIRVYAEMALFV